MKWRGNTPPRISVVAHMRKGTLLALGGIGALTHSIVWHQMQTESAPAIPPLPAYGEVPEPATGDANNLVVHSCVVVGDEIAGVDGSHQVRIHATITNTGDMAERLGGVDYVLLDEEGNLVEGVDAHPPLRSDVEVLGSGRRVRLVDSNAAPADAAECRPTGVARQPTPTDDPGAKVLDEVELSGCAGDDAFVTAQRPAAAAGRVTFVVEYFDIDGYSLGQSVFSHTAGDAASDDKAISVAIGGSHPETAVYGCEVVRASIAAA
jgi:hypothetical protein